jgi:hypothetical protein
MSNLKIIVLDKGFVFIGRVSGIADRIIIDEAYNIRKWGTSEGIGQLRNGPLAETVLDSSGTITAHKHAVLFFIDCDPTKWTSHYK